MYYGFIAGGDDWSGSCNRRKEWGQAHVLRNFAWTQTDHTYTGLSPLQENSRGKLDRDSVHMDGFLQALSPLQTLQSTDAKYKSEESAIQEYCSHNGLCFSIENKCFRVETPRSLWKITPEDNSTCTMLYHKNELHLEKRRHDRVPGYHCQGVCYPTLLGYLEYIVEHDYFRMLNPIHPAPKKKEPPRKGTKRYRKQQKRAKSRRVENPFATC